MGKFLKILVIIIAAIIVIIFGLIGYVSWFKPSVGEPEDITINATPEMIEKGKYLASHVHSCIDCHSTRNWNYFSGPIEPGTLGKGGEIFPEEAGFPGTYFSCNITPYNLKDWTDGEILRSITCGVDNEGEPIFPIMPYPYYRETSFEDLKAIIAYIRTLEPIEHETPESQPTFPFKLILRIIPDDVDVTENTAPDPSNKVKYGQYLAKVAGCVECHTPHEKGRPVMEKKYTGGWEFPLPTGGKAVAPNLTPHKGTGLGNWTEKKFIEKFKYYLVKDTVQVGDTIKVVEKPRRTKVEKGEFNTIMPWTQYAGMTREDLSAIYAYLMSLEPVENNVQTFIPPGE